MLKAAVSGFFVSFLSPVPSYRGKSNQEVYTMYTPQFSQTATVTVRRLAWALGLPMPKTVDKITVIFSPSAVCPLCKDNTKCQLCESYQVTAEKVGIENMT
jgi:hypothetical protein